MDILIIGLNHKSAEIGERETVSKKLLTIELRRDFTNKLFDMKDENGRPFIKEIVVLTTCNRSEFIMHLPSRAQGKGGHIIKSYIAKYFFGDAARENIFYMHLNEDAVSHLFSVASSLDSMIIGEPQILGQLKEAYNEACKFKPLGVPWVEPEEVAPLVVFLATDAARKVSGAAFAATAGDSANFTG